MLHDSLLHLNVDRQGAISRRRFAQLAGAPSQLEMWDPKPGTETGGETKSIRTQVSGLEIAEHWPRMAKVMREAAVIRSIKGREAAHDRGTYHLHTGRRMGGPEKHPNFGSVVASKLGDPQSDIPNFVSIGQTISSGFLGVQVAPFIVNRAGQLPANVASGIPRTRRERRLSLLADQDREFATAGASHLAEEHQELYTKAARLMNSPRLKSFQLDDEPAAMKEAFGSSPFRQGLLVARRLVEAGVPFVEVRKGGWDMHNSIFEKIGPASADVDGGLAQLLTDLKQRGMLEKTLVICMGEFGRTPKINARTPLPGRDHWARNFNMLLAGGGIRGGQVIGSTSADGTEIVDREVSVEDIFQSFCRAMQIDASEELYTPGGRPLAIVDGGQVITELF